MAELLKDRLRKWRGKRRQKEAAADLDVSVASYRQWEYGKRTPNKLAMAELERRMAGEPMPFCTYRVKDLLRAGWKIDQAPPARPAAGSS